MWRTLALWFFWLVCLFLPFLLMRIFLYFLKWKVIFLRKEVIQPHLPIRLPCYDFTPVILPTFDCCFLLLAHRLRVLITPMVWRAVCTRPGNAFTAAFWSAITSNSDFMFSSCREQSELRSVLWALLRLTTSLPFVPTIVARVLPRAYRAWWFDVIPTFLRFIIGSPSRVPNFTCW